MFTATILLTLLQLLYHRLTTNVKQFPFNSIRNYSNSRRFTEMGVNGLSMGYPVIACMSQQPVPAMVSLAELVLMLAGEYFTSWNSHFSGSNKLWQKHWEDLYNRVFKPILLVLPPIGPSPLLSLEHCLLHVVMLCCFIVMLVYHFDSVLN